MKKLLSILTLLLCVATGAWADNYTHFISSNTEAGYYTASSPSHEYEDGVTWTFSPKAAGTANVNSSASKYPKTTSATTITISGISGTVTEIKIYGAKGSSTDVIPSSVKVGGTEFSTTATTFIVKGSFNAQSNYITYTGTGVAGDIVISLPEYSNGIYFEGVAVTYTPVGGKTTLTGSWSDAAPSFTIGDDANSSLPTFSVTGGATLDTDYTVAYTLVSGTLATVDASTGITAINTSATGTATVRATVALTATGEESYTLSTTTYDCVITVEDVPTLTAVTSKTWDFSTWTKEKYTTTQIIDNLEIVATSAKNIEVDGNSKTFEGVSYTQRIKLGGSGAPDDRCLHFKVNGPSLISVYGMSGKTGEDRPLGITVNETEEQTTFSGDEVRKAVYIYKETGTGVDVYVYSKSSGINIYGIKVEPLRSITLNSSGYATFSYEKPVQLISDDATAYTAALDFGAGTIDCTAIEDNKVPAGNGVLLYGGNGATVYISEIASAPALSSNNLHGTTDASGNLVDKGANTYYVLSGSTFKKYTGTVFAANKAYFEVAGSAVQAPERFTIQFNDDVVTGIQNVTGDSQPRVRKYLKDGRLVIENANGVFTLSGARVK